MAEPTRERDADKSAQGKPRAIAAAAVVLVVGGLVWRCSKSTIDGAPSASSSSAKESPTGAPSPGLAPAGLIAPISASHIGADVVVAGLDIGAKAIRVQRINAKDEIVADQLAFRDVAPSTDSDLKLVATSEGALVRWRGLRAGQLVRELVVLDANLVIKGQPSDVPASWCTTRDAVWFSDGVNAFSRPWLGAPARVRLPKEKDASLLCGQHRAFAVLDDDDKTLALPLGEGGGAAVTMVREDDFGDDEQRELAEYTVGDDVGFVRLGTSGALAIRELTGEGAGALHKLKRGIGRDDDVVAVDASPQIVVIVYTQDASEAAKDADTTDTTSCTKVAALRVDRNSMEASTIELSSGRCGYEVGPFFTSAVGEDVSVAWTERTGGAGRARAPIAALAHSLVGKAGIPGVKRIDQPADALVDAGCEGSSCYAVALVRRDGADAAGIAKVLRYK